MNTRILSILSAGFIATAAFGQTQFYDYNTPADFGTDFNTTGSALSNASSGGLNNSGFIQYSGSDANGFSTTTAATVTTDTSGDFTLTQSTYFLTNLRTDTFERDNRRAVQLGLTEASSVTYSGGGLVGEASLTAGIYVNDAFVAGTPDTMTVDFFASTTGTVNNFSLTSNNYVLNDDSWYYLAIDYNYIQATDEWQVDWSLSNSDSAGTLGSLVGSASSPNGANVLGANPGLRGYFGTRSAQRTSIGGLDNTSLVAIPEPSTLVLVGLALGSVVLFRRRSR
jgi:hypothetical protein